MIASDIIYASLRLIGGGTFAAGETPSASENADALAALNLIIDNWSIEQLTIYQIVQQAFPTVGGTQTYTLGPTGSWNYATRPVKIQSPGVIVSGLRHDLRMVSPVDWAALPEKALSGVLPRVMWDDNAYPLKSIRLSPIPSGIVSIDLFMWVPLTQFATVGDTVSLPPAYARALKYQLAIDLAPEYDRPVPDDVHAIAIASKQDIIRLNTSNALANLPSDNPAPPEGQEQ